MITTLLPNVLWIPVPSVSCMPTLQLECVMKLIDLNSGCCAITPTRLLSLAGFFLILYATVQVLWISLRPKPWTGGGPYAMPVFL